MEVRQAISDIDGVMKRERRASEMEGFELIGEGAGARRLAVMDSDMAEGDGGRFVAIFVEDASGGTKRRGR